MEESGTETAQNDSLEKKNGKDEEDEESWNSYERR